MILFLALNFGRIIDGALFAFAYGVGFSAGIYFARPFISKVRSMFDLKIDSGSYLGYLLERFFVYSGLFTAGMGIWFILISHL